MTLVDNYFPFDTGPGSGATAARWRLMGRLFYPSGVVPGYLNQCQPSQAGSVVTIQPGAVWIDGYYGEGDSAKTVSVSGTGQVVARMDPTARQVIFVFVANQTTPTQNLTGIYEVPIWNTNGTTGSDARVYSTPLKPPSRTVVAESMLWTSANTSYSSTTWSNNWWGETTFTKTRPDTVLDFYYNGSAYSQLGGAYVEYGLQIVSPNASGIGVLSHFYFNTVLEHHTITGGLRGYGTELITAGATGTVTISVYVRTATNTYPQWHINADDEHYIRVVERMP